MEIISKNAAETVELAKRLAEEVKHGGILCLYGDLGSGKTTFTQGLAKALGIEKHVNSPTFLIMRTYTKGEMRKERSDKKLYHVDLYRLETEQEMEDIGLREILEDPENIVVIEWAEKLGSLLPRKRIDIKFQYIDNEKRTIMLEHH